MKNRSILTLILVFIPLLIYAEETPISLVALKQNGQSQVYNINDYPRLTIRNVNGNPSFYIKDKQNITTNDVRTCIFKTVETNDIEVVITDETNNQKIRKYVKNGTLYIEYNGIFYTATGQRIK